MNDPGQYVEDNALNRESSKSGEILEELKVSTEKSHSTRKKK